MIALCSLRKLHAEVDQKTQQVCLYVEIHVSCSSTSRAWFGLDLRMIQSYPVLGLRCCQVEGELENGIKNNKNKDDNYDRPKNAMCPVGLAIFQQEVSLLRICSTVCSREPALEIFLGLACCCSSFAKLWLSGSPT